MKNFKFHFIFIYYLIFQIITENQGVIKTKRVLICTGAFTNFKNFPMPKLQINISKETAALLKVNFKEARRLRYV